MGYYYETESTGVPEVDAIGHAIDAAGNAYHHTSDWHEQDGNGRCVLDDINDALKACAAEITRLRTPAPVPPVVAEEETLRSSVESVLSEIASALSKAYDSAEAVCCGRGGAECCGCPDPHWDDTNKAIMDTLGPIHERLTAALRPVDSHQSVPSDYEAPVVPVVTDNKPPQPAFTVEISVGGCEWERVAHVLAEAVERMSGPEYRIVWGGAGTHGHVHITTRDVTPEQYNRELSEWVHATRNTQHTASEVRG